MPIILRCMKYNFATLLADDFEDLMRDLVGLELGVRFGAFTVAKMPVWTVATRSPAAR